ncbi:angiotensin-converting enzyme-like [Macrobrachium rosenbergii]|uniref:angiotensin-converting enzyme-like n=1 Tax=Macrobrachium rosenbergii TaxID=79674 RepID=UPI0034D446B0
MKLLWPNQRLTLALLGSLFLASLGAAGPRKYKIHDEREAEEFMKELDVRYSHECNLETLARWDYMVDVTDADKEAAANKAAVRYLDFKGEAAVNSSKFDYSGFESVDLYRRFRFLSKKGPGALGVDDLTKYKDHQSKMENIYSTATICDYHDPTQCGLTLEPDIELIMATSEDWEELRYVWDQWREVSGKLMREDFIQFVELSNKAAALDGFRDTSEYWLNSYTVDEREAAAFQVASPLSQDQFQAMTDQVWQKVSAELYKKLHSWVRWKMADVYPEHIDLTGPLPAHILGNMWGQDWVNIADRVMPFPEFPTYDVSESMVQNGWDIQQIFESAEDFFESIGLFPMTQTFWDKSVVNQTEWGKVMMCHASAEDFCLGSEGEDYRIKMCTEVNMEDLVTVHHEMGHIEYFMAYKNLPHVFRDSANPGIHEAIGDLIALSVSTPSHLENVLHLMPGEGVKSGTSSSSEHTDDEKRDLNFLMRMALEKIAFLPFGYLIDKFRWGVFEGSIPTDQMNAAWWQLRQELQGVTPPGGSRGEEFFDAGAKFHVPANVPYIRYFVSFITQFQFHAHLCQVAGHQGPLHNCDIYNNRDAGAVLRNALERGFSEPWPVVLKDLGGSPDMDPQAIISYFDPLIRFLDDELAKAGQCIGWGEDCVKSRAAASDQVGNARVLALESINSETSAQSTSVQSTSVSSTSAQSTSEQSTSASITSVQSTSEQSSSEQSTSASTTSMQSTSDQSTSVQSTSASPTSVPSTSEQSTSDHSTSASTTSVPSTSVPTSESSTTVPSTTVTAPSSSPVTELPTTEPVTDDPTDEKDAKKRLEEMDAEMTIHVQAAALADWNYETNMTEQMKNASIKAWMDVKNNFSVFHSTTIDYFHYEGFKDEDVKRQFELQKNLGAAALPKDDLQKLTDIVSRMVSTLSKKVCPATNSKCDAESEGMGIYELEAKMTNATETYDNLEYYWLEWREVSKELLEDYKEYVVLENKTADLNGFGNAGLLWIDPYTDANYTSDDFVSEVADLWNQTKPFYANLRAYVFHKLKMKYGDDITTNDLIPAHILGDMYGENWESLYDLVAPYNVTLPDISDLLNDKLDTVSNMTREVEEYFFVTMGLKPMTTKFWDNSTLENNGDMVCQPSAWDFYDVPKDSTPDTDGDFRIKMCAAKTQEDFITLHHEMAHIEYMMAYSSRGDDRKEIMPIVFRDGANPAFHEAVGSAIGLSARNPDYLKSVAERLSKKEEFTIHNAEMDDEMIVNHLMKIALAKIPVLPYAYILDSWRWKVFSDDTITDYNKRWWELRIAEQGIAPPTKRFPKSEFDVGSKFDVAVSTPYIWRFVAQVLQFQIHHKLGEICRCKDDINCPIWSCDEAGTALTKLMSLGRSVRWQKALGDFLGDETGGLSSEALKNFFMPLEDFLTTYITDNEISVQWNPDQINKYMDKEREEISATVPIVVGVVLACMVVVVIVAYFVGQKKQKKKLKAMESQVESGGHTNMEMKESKKEESSDSEEEEEKEKEKETLDERF